MGAPARALSAFSNDLTTFSNLSNPGALQAANTQVHHTVGNIASTRAAGQCRGQGAGVNSVFLQDRLVHNQGGSSNLSEVINQQGQIPYSRIVDAPDQPDGSRVQAARIAPKLHHQCMCLAYVYHPCTLTMPAYKPLCTQE